MNITTIVVGLVFTGLTAVGGVQLLSAQSDEQAPTAQSETVSRAELQHLADDTTEPEKNDQSADEPESDSSPEESGRTITIKPGDTLDKIAERKDVSPDRLFNANPSLGHPDLIKVGQSLYVPAEHEEFTERKVEEPSPIASNEPQAEPAPESRPAQPEPSPAPSETSTTTSSNTGTWDKLAECESGGNWSINTGNGYYGGLQFSLSSWQAVGGAGYPHQASKSEQIARAEQLQQIQGWGAWPACASKLGLL